jgi:uncharacterized protein (TIGR03435 family)
MRNLVFVLVLVGGSTYSVAGQATGDSRPSFEVTSVKPCNDPGGRRGGGVAPGRLDLTCQTLGVLIHEAYAVFVGPAANGGGYDVPLVGAPDWVFTQGYLVTATASGQPSRTLMRGPMLQTLLENRFKLKVRPENRDLPIYALTMGPGPVKMPKVDETACVARDTSKRPVPGVADPNTQKPFCQTIIRGASSIAGSMTAQELTDAIGSFVERHVVNQTNLSGIFSVHLEFAAEGRGPAAAAAIRAPTPGGAVSIFTAIQEQLGLRLEPSRGPAPVLVVEHVERPTEN